MYRNACIANRHNHAALSVNLNFFSINKLRFCNIVELISYEFIRKTIILIWYPYCLICLQGCIQCREGLFPTSGSLSEPGPLHGPPEIKLPLPETPWIF
jgi:hypothetical protein